jgi:hypothetical protein
MNHQKIEKSSNQFLQTAVSTQLGPATGRYDLLDSVDFWSLKPTIPTKPLILKKKNESNSVSSILACTAYLPYNIYFLISLA